MKLFILYMLICCVGLICLTCECDKQEKLSRYYREKYIEQKRAFTCASTLLKYHDSINNSGLIINLSKYQYEYIKREIDKKR